MKYLRITYNGDIYLVQHRRWHTAFLWVSTKWRGYAGETRPMRAEYESWDDALEEYNDMRDKPISLYPKWVVSRDE